MPNAPQLDAPSAVLPISFTYQVEGNEVQFSLTSLNQTNNYFWDFGDGITSTELNPLHTYTGTGPFIVTLLNELCYETLVSVQVVSFGVGLHEPTEGQWLLYPNPVSEVLNVQTQTNDFSLPVSLLFYDGWGRLVLQTPLHQPKERVSLAALPAGHYRCVVQSGAGELLGGQTIVKW